MFLGYFSVHNLMGVIEEGDKVWEGSKKSKHICTIRGTFFGGKSAYCF